MCVRVVNDWAVTRQRRVCGRMEMAIGERELFISVCAYVRMYTTVGCETVAGWEEQVTRMGRHSITQTSANDFGWM